MAGIVLIDLHQLNVKTTSDNTTSDTEYGQTSCQRRTEPAEQQPATSGFPNQMIEQINIALEQKGSGNFSAWVIEVCRRRLTSEKRAYTSTTLRRMNIPQNALIDYRHSTNGDNKGTIFCVYHSDSDRLRVGSVTD